MYKLNSIPSLQIIVMIKHTNLLSIDVPVDSKKRYTIEHFIDLAAATSKRGKVEIMRELSEALSKNKNTKMSMWMLYKYSAEKAGSQRAELSIERRKIIARYFGLNDPDMVITTNMVD
jgi:hypothetical protein